METSIVAKLLVLAFGGESATASLAQCVLDGAQGVRFTEVDLRSGGRSEPETNVRQRPIESAEQLVDYDGVLLVCAAPGGIPRELTVLLDALDRVQPPAAFANTVFGVVGGETEEPLARLARLGGIIVSIPRGGADLESKGTALGARAAKVVEWIRHGLSHEQHHHH